VDRTALDTYQEENDALMASNTLKRAFHCDVSPILAEARRRAGGAIDPIACYRAASYRAHIAQARPEVAGSRSGIV
jgi:L-rhamnose isomerase/sugar isomerase